MKTTKMEGVKADYFLGEEGGGQRGLKSIDFVYSTHATASRPTLRDPPDPVYIYHACLFTDANIFSNPLNFSLSLLNPPPISPSVVQFQYPSPPLISTSI